MAPPPPGVRPRERKAEELSKGNQQKIQMISAVLHDPPVLLMDEPFTGLDPVNVALLRETLLELRDDGRTLVFSTHQMETVEAMCESIAIIDHGRVVVGGTLREIKRGSGRRLVKLSVEDDHRLPWLAGVPGARILRPGSSGRRSDSTRHRSRTPSSRRHRRRGAGQPLRGRGPVARTDLHRPRRPFGGGRSDDRPAVTPSATVVAAPRRDVA